MPAILMLTTSDARLAAEWGGQLGASGAILPEADDLRRELALGGARVWIKDLADPRSRQPAHPDVIAVVVGQPQSLPYEQARLAGAGRFFLSYDESRTRLREVVDTASELAEKNAIIRTLEARQSRPPFPMARERASAAPAPAAADLTFVETAIEHLDDRGRILEEFHRAALASLRAARLTLFLRGTGGYRSDRHAWTSSADSLLTRRLEDYPCAIDLDDWTRPFEPAAESFIRQQMQSWGARLLVPLFEAGRLAGWAAFGPRADGRPYDAADHDRALQLGRLLERCLEKSDRLLALGRAADAESLRARYLAGARLLGPDAPGDVSLPPEIRSLAGEVLRTGRPARLEPGPTMRFRAEAGPVAETGGVWVQWQEASAELADRAATGETERLRMCRELGLTMSHELGGPLVTFTTFLQLARQQGATPDLLAEFSAQLESDAGKLRDLTRLLHLMQEFMGGSTVRLDLGELVRHLDLRGAYRLEPNEAAPALDANEAMLRFALQAIADGLARNRTEADGLITLAVKRRGEGDNETGLVVFSGKNLQLEGFLEPAPGALPVHPLLGIFLAREIIRWHRGTFQAGQGLTGPEIQIALRSRPATSAVPPIWSAPIRASTAPFAPSRPSLAP